MGTLTIISGDNAFLMHRSLRRVHQGLGSPTRKALKQPNAMTLLEVLGTQPLFFQEPELVMVENFAWCHTAPKAKGDDKRVESLLGLLKALPEMRHVVFVAEKFDKRLSFAKQLAGMATRVLEHTTPPPWKDRELVALLLQVADEDGLGLTEPQAREVVRLAGPLIEDQMGLIGTCTLITGGPIDLGVMRGLKPAYQNVFDWTAQWLAHELPGTALLNAFCELSKHEPPLKLLGLMRNKTQEVAALKQGLQQGVSNDELAKRLKKHPYVLQLDSKRFAQTPLPRLWSLLSRLAEAERVAKTGEMPAPLALDLLVAQHLSTPLPQELRAW
jgi:DNA polymerase III subunit delta